jgi:hypothetical protein
MNTRTRDENPWKTCPNCGQGVIPFKLGVCICGIQVGKIQYVQNAGSFAQSHYSYVSADLLGYDTAIEETFAGIPEVEY